MKNIPLRFWLVILSTFTGAGIAPAQSTYEPYAFTTVAGHPVFLGRADGVGSAALFRNPSGTAVDSAGNVYVADTFNSSIRKITPGGGVTTFAGDGFDGDSDGTGSAARFRAPYGVAVGTNGMVYVADTYNHTIRKITPAGVVTTLAGLAGAAGSTDGTGSAAQFRNPQGVAVDSAGNVYVADTQNHTIRKITPGGGVTTLAGLAGSTGNTDANGSAARFYTPNSVAVDSTGNVYVADTSNEAIRKITPGGVVTTLAGGTFGSADGTGSAAQFYFLQGVAVDANGIVYVADGYYGASGSIRKITPSGVVTTLAGLANEGGSTDGTGSAARFVSPYGVAVDSTGNLYVSDSYNCTIRKVTPGGDVSTLAGTAGLGSANGTGAAARFNGPTGMAVDSATNVYVADRNNHTIRKITPAGDVSTLAGLAGNSGNTDGTGSAARFYLPVGLAVDPAGNVYVADTQNGVIRKITPAGVVSTVASGFFYPFGVAVDNVTNLYVANTYGSTIRKVSPLGVVSPLAGASVTPGSADGTGAAARFNYPGGVAVDSAGNVYVADTQNHTIRKITPAAVVTTLAGSAGISGSTDGTGSAARFSVPQGVAVDNAGNVYVADTGNYSIRKITSAGVVTTLGGVAAYPGGSSDGIGVGARFSHASGIAVDGVGKVYVADTGNHTIRTDFPALTLAPIPTGNNAGILLAGWLGQQYRLDYKDDLRTANWTVLTTVTLANGSTQITDSQSAGVPKRFYRAVPLP